MGIGRRRYVDLDGPGTEYVGGKDMPGSLHYIPGGVAHRVANTGNSVLSFAACWPSDAGHNYEEIANKGFSARLVEVNGTPKLR